MNNPRVLVILDSANVFGRERSNVQVFSFLREFEYQVLFITDAERGRSTLIPFLSEHGFASRQINFAGLFSKRMSISSWITKVWYLFKGGFRLLMIIRNFKPTHIHLSNPNDFLGVWYGLMLTKIPIIYRVGDAPLKRPIIYQWIWRWLIKPRVSKFVCISQFIKDCLDEVPGQSDAQVIYNFPPERVPVYLHDYSSNRDDSINIVFIGQIIHQKGVHVFVDAACNLCHQFPNMKFIVAGPTDQDKDYFLSLIQLIEEKQLMERFSFPGHIENVYSLLGTCDLHIMPSIYQEPLGNVVVEAKSVGIPSVVFPVGGTPELIEHKVDGFICSDTTVIALKEGIEFFLKSPDTLRKAGEAAKQSLQRLGISKESFVQAWRQVYERDNN